MRLEAILDLLEEKPMTVRQIILALDLDPSMEKEVYEKLKKASKVLKRRGKKLLISPATCRKCGFEFESIKPSKCPKCKSEWIEPAKFFVSKD
ncbi:MAG: transcriptional regulator [Archaeoglobaceae archaeon]